MEKAKSETNKALVVCVASTKGGTGKSLVSTAIVDALSSEARQVALLDADQQQPHSLMWNELREKNQGKTEIYAKSVDVGNLEAEIQGLERSVETIIVDIPISTPETLKALQLSDVLIVPVNDGWGEAIVEQAINEIGAIQKEKPGLQAAILGNMASTTMKSQAFRASVKTANVGVFSSQMSRNSAYAEAFSHGVGPATYTHEPTKLEFQSFLGELTTMMAEHVTRRAQQETM